MPWVEPDIVWAGGVGKEQRVHPLWSHIGAALGFIVLKLEVGGASPFVLVAAGAGDEAAEKGDTFPVVGEAKLALPNRNL